MTRRTQAETDARRAAEYQRLEDAKAERDALPRNILLRKLRHLSTDNEAAETFQDALIFLLEESGAE